MPTSALLRLGRHSQILGRQLFLQKLGLPPTRASRWIPIALAGKLLVALALLWNGRQLTLNPGKLHQCVGDCIAYVATAEHLKSTGTYALYTDAAGNPIPYAGRLPGYEWVIALLGSVLEPSTAFTVLFALQLGLAAVSVYYLALIAWQVFKSHTAFLITFFTYLSSAFITVFDLGVLTESFAASSLIFACYFLLRNRSAYDLLMAGCWLGWAIFLRQLAAPFLLFAVVYLLHRGWAQRAKTATVLTGAFLLGLPFALADGAWIVRNLVQKKAFIPLVDDLHAGYGYPQRHRLLMDFVQTWGGDIVHWNPVAEITPFMRPGIARQPIGNYPGLELIPPYAYTSEYNADSLRKLQYYYHLGESERVTDSVRRAADGWTLAALPRFAESFKREKPFHYRVVAPLRLLPKFVLHTGTFYTATGSFSALDPARKAFTLFNALHYLFVFSFGLLGCLWVWRPGAHQPGGRLLATIGLFVLLACPLLLRRVEYRYFVLAYPFFVLLAGYLVASLYNWLVTWSLRTERTSRPA